MINRKITILGPEGTNLYILLQFMIFSIISWFTLFSSIESIEFETSNILLETKKIREQMLSSFEQKESNPMYQEIQIVINVPEFNEKSKPKPISLYSKLCLKYEKYLKKSKKIPFTIMRLGTLYGWSERMRYDIAINKILREYAEKNSIDMIISSNQILIGKSELDVTKEILELVNNKIKKFEIKYDN